MKTKDMLLTREQALKLRDESVYMHLIGDKIDWIRLAIANCIIHKTTPKTQSSIADTIGGPY